MTGSPAVSVVLPVLDGERYIREAILSVLQQGHEPLELIVVDDGSSDNTRDVVRSMRGPIIVIDHGSRNVGSALDRGIEEARGDLVAFIDHDDRWPPGRLNRQVTALLSDPALDAVAGHVRQFHSEELTPSERRRLPLPPTAEPGLVYGALLIRRTALDRVGGFEAVDSVSVMFSWWARAQAAGINLEVLDDVVLERRVHGGNLTLTSGDQVSLYARALKSALDERRAGSGRS